MKMTKKSLTLLLTLTFITFSYSVMAQRSTMVLVCNERDSVSEVLNYPRQATVRKTANGNVSYVENRAQIGNDKGNYHLRISSYSDFNFDIVKRSKSSRNEKWQRVKKGDSAVRDVSGGNVFYKIDYTFKSPGFYSSGVDIAIAVKPYYENDVTFTWYTTNCKKSENEPICKGSEEDAFLGQPGTGRWVCRCGGIETSASRCGPRPGGSSFMEELNISPPSNKYFDWMRQRNTILFEKNVSVEHLISDSS